MVLFETIYSFLRNKDYRDLLLTSVFILGVGTVTFHKLEGWSWIDSFYFSVITLTTVGYGDFSPQTPWGKIFTIFYIFIGIGIILSFVNTVYNHYEKLRIDKRNNY